MSKTLYRQLLRSANHLKIANNTAPRAKLVFRDSIHPTLAPSGAATLDLMLQKWRTNYWRNYWLHNNASSAAGRPQDSINTSSASVTSYDTHGEICQLLRDAFERPVADGEDDVTLALEAFRDMNNAAINLRESRRWHVFAGASINTEHTTVLDAATADNGMCKIEHVVNAHLVEYGLSMVAGLREGAPKSSKQILVDVGAWLDNVATMGQYNIDSREREAQENGIPKEEQILSSLNQVFFHQHAMRVHYNPSVERVERVPSEDEQHDQPASPSQYMYDEVELDPNLFFVDQVIENTEGTPLVLGALYTAALSRMGMAAQVLIVPHTQQVLVVGAAPRCDLEGERRCLVVDVAQSGKYQNVPITQLENALQNMHPHQCLDPAAICTCCTNKEREGRQGRDLAARNLLRSVDLCIHLAKRLVMTLSHSSAHRTSRVDERDEQLRVSCVNLVTDLVGAVESGGVTDLIVDSELHTTCSRD